MGTLVTIDKKTAEKEFERLCLSWHVEVDVTGTDDAAEAARQGMESIVKGLMKGALVVMEQGDKDAGLKLKLVHHLTEPLDKEGKNNSLSYRFVTAGDMICLDEYKAQHTFKRMIALVSTISGQGQPAIRNMISKDLLLGQCVGALFLAA